MTKKKLIALFSIVFVILFIVIMMTVFTLQSVNVFFVAPTLEHSFEVKKIIDDGNFAFGKSLFLQNKDDYIARIEKNNPYAKVVQIETKFPNRFVVYIEERQVLYSLHNEIENTYVLLDEDFKVLDIVDEEAYWELELTPIAIECANYTIVYQFGEGDFLQLSTANDVFHQISQSLQSYDYNILAMKSMIQSIQYNMLNEQIRIETKRDYGIEMLIDGTSNLLDEKLGIAFDGFETLKQNHQTNVVVCVFEKDGQISYEIRSKT